MARHRTLKGVAHNLADHCTSALSWMHPHVCQACSEKNLDSIVIELVSSDPCPEHLRDVIPLTKAIPALKERFILILERDGHTLETLVSARVEFFPMDKIYDHHSTECHVRLETKGGKVYERMVDMLGRKKKV